MLFISCSLVAWSIIPIHLKLNESLLDIPRQPTCMNLGTEGLYQPLLDIPRQLTCMKLGTGGLYRPIQSYMCKQGSYMSFA